MLLGSVALIAPGIALADAPLPTEYVSVTDFGNASTPMSDRIDQAIAAAAATAHKTVFFPNGTYALRESISLDVGSNSEIHLIGESRDGVLLVPDKVYLEANYNGNSGPKIDHMINLNRGSVFNSIDVSIQNMTIDMLDQQVLGQNETYRTNGHGIRVGQGWQTGQFTVNEVTIRNPSEYGVGIQDRDGHPKSNVTLSNLSIENTGSDGIDLKEGDANLGGNQNLVIRDVNINEIGILDSGTANGIDIRYTDATIERVNLVSGPGAGGSRSAIAFRPGDSVNNATVSDVYVRGFQNGVQIHGQHNNIAVSDFKVQGHWGNAVRIIGSNHSGHTISDGFVDPASGNVLDIGGQATVTNVVNERWDPALTPLTSTAFLGDVSLAGETFSPAWAGYVGPERVSLNPTAGAGPFTFDVSSTGVLQIDFDGIFKAADRLIVDGTLNLAGELRVNLLDVEPTTPGTFQIFDATAITGAFNTITLPTLGSGLSWNTNNLAIDGTLGLVQPGPVRSITLGDADTSYGPSDPDDNPPIDPGFQTDLAAVSGSWTFKGLDEAGRNDVRGMTLSFDPLTPESLLSVWIEARVLGESGYENDSMILDFVGNIRRLSDMEGFNTNGDWMTLRYNLDPSEFALLSDGQLNLAFLDDTRVDWVTLSWTSIPEPGSLAVLGLGVLIFSIRTNKRL